jgi:hypothetical protein
MVMHLSASPLINLHFSLSFFLKLCTKMHSFAWVQGREWGVETRQKRKGNSMLSDQERAGCAFDIAPNLAYNEDTSQVNAPCYRLADQSGTLNTHRYPSISEKRLAAHHYLIVLSSCVFIAQITGRPTYDT